MGESLSQFTIQELEEFGIEFHDSINKNLELCITSSFERCCGVGRNHKEALSDLLEELTNKLSEYTEMIELIKLVLKDSDKQE